MLNVYILEDNKPYLAFLKQSVRNALTIEGITAVHLVAATEPQGILMQIDEQNLDTSLFFLDIEIAGSEQDGVTVADWIRSKSALAEIIFITSHSENAIRIITHRIAPLDLIPKAEDEATIVARIHADIVTIQKRQANRKLHTATMFSYVLGSRVFSIPLNELEYIQTVAGSPGELEVHSIKEDATFAGNLNQIEKKFTTLFRCHKSVLINPEQVESLDVDNRFVYFRSGARVEISFRKLAAAKRILLDR